MASKKSYSEPWNCAHCGNRAPMEILASTSRLEQLESDNGPNLEVGYIYQTLICPACSEIIFRRYFWFDTFDPEDAVFELLYPSPQSLPAGLPKEIARAFEAAKRVRPIDPNAYGTLLGRVLEKVCMDRGAKGRFLGNKLDDLAARGEIPSKLVDVANGLKDLRNVGAHAELGELTVGEVPVLDELTRAILEYVYSAPALARRAEALLAKLRKKSSLRVQRCAVTRKLVARTCGAGAGYVLLSLG